MSGTVAIVGRPNVGKSALFNRIVGRRVAIVHDQPGVTRDRVIATAEYLGHPFSLIDTGGIGLMRGEKTEDVITAAALKQVEIAIDAADILLLVVNVQEGIVPLDQEVARKLRLLRKPVLVVVNKVDSAKAAPGIPEFTALGFDRLFPVTAIHGDGIQALLDAVIALLPQPSAETATDLDVAADEEPASKRRSRRNKGGANTSVAASSLAGLKLAIVGRPNVGKSSIINALTGSERVVVSPIPGTTRDAIDVPFEVTTEGQTENYVLIDTAGVRKARRVDTTLEYFTVERTREAIARCDLAILVLDAEAGITEQDKKIADIITENRRACIVVVNKWDLVAEEVRKKREAELTARSEKTRDRDDREERLTTLAEFGEWVQSKLFFLDYAPVIFTSAKDGFQLDRLLEAVRYVAAQLKQKVPTAILNRTLNDAIERRQPVSSSGRRLTFYYATQVRLAPPTFLLFVNRDDDLSEPYTKYLSGAMRKAFGYEGCPVVLVPKPRPKTIKTIRRPRKHPYAEPGRRHPGGAKRPRPRV